MAKTSFVYVRRILGAIENIAEDLEGADFESFRTDRRARQLLDRNLEIISEASRRVPEELKEIEKEFPGKRLPVSVTCCAMTTTRPIRLFCGKRLGSASAHGCDGAYREKCR